MSYTYSSSADVTSSNFDYVTGASYSPLGTLQQLNLANQVATTLGWNNLVRLTSILTQKSGSAALLNLGYSYYANDQIQQITNNLDSLKTEKYTYDELRRLLTAQRGPDTNIQCKYSYDYDRFGNRWGQTLVAGSGFGGTNSFDYTNNRVTSPNFSFDNSGNITANGPGTSFTFNQENFITAASASNSYSVDTRGRRVKKTVSGVTTSYFYSGSVVISEQQGSAWTDYIFFGNQRIAQQTGSTLTAAKFLHQDHLGSTRVCSDGSGNSAGTCDYEPFGEFQPGSACSSLPTNYRFAGMEFDLETALYHTIFRQYDPNQGRWMSVDPIPGSADNPQSGSRYELVLGDPVNSVDPLGLEPCRWMWFDAILRTYQRTISQGGDPVPNPDWQLVSEEHSQVQLLVCGGGPERLGGRDGGAGGTKVAYVDTKVLGNCLQQLFNVELYAFKGSTPGGSGYFIGYGRDSRQHSQGGRDGASGIIVVANDATTYNFAQISQIVGTPSFGYTPPGNPYNNFTNNNNNSIGTLQTQVHELGHSLFAITSGLSSLVPDRVERGTSLEDCVRNNGGFRRR